MRIVFHAINGVGLGHLVRTWCLAREVRAQHPGAAILFVTNTRDPQLLRDDGFDFVHLPPRLSEPHADPTRASTGLPDDLDSLAVLAALEVFRPDLVVFDTHAPPGLVEATTALGARAVLVLRELRPDVMDRWLASPAAGAFDQLLVPHGEDEVTAALPDAVPVFLVGPIVRPAPAPADEGPDVLVVAGGGGQPVEVERLLRAAADAHWLARARYPTLETTLVAGPGLRRLPTYPGLTVRRPGSDVPALMAAAKVVVAQAGYNTVAELRALRKPAILVPGHRRMEDQSARARRLVAVGAALLSRPEAGALGRKLVTALHPNRRARMATAHDRWPLVPRNHEAASAVLRVLRAPAGPVSRVVVVAHDFPPRIGGMETVARELSAALAADGAQVTVYTTNRVGLGQVEGVQVRPLFASLPAPQTIDSWRDLLLTLDALLRDRPDVVHLSNAGLAPWVPLLRAVWPCRVTVHVHGNDLLTPWVQSGSDPEAYRQALHAGLRAADAVIPVSVFSAGLARRAGVEAERLHVVSNGVSLPAEVPGPVDGAEVLTVSRLARRKGHGTVVAALPHLPGVRYAFTGRDEGQIRALRELAQAHGVGDRVLALGFLSEAALAARYAGAKVFVLVPDDRDPADVEGFGVALLEAAAHGLPVVASRTGGIPEAVEDGVTGILVPPGDPEGTAAAIGRLLADPALAERMGSAGRARARTSFSWPSAAAALRKVWDGVEAGTGSLDGAWALASSPPVDGAPPHVLALRDAIRACSSPASLARLARSFASDQRREGEQRRERYQREVARDRTLRLRATGDGERLLAGVLDDCAAVGAVPELELRLGRFLDPAFRAAVLPRVGQVVLHHSVPAPDGPSVRGAVDALSPTDAARVRSVHLHLRAEATDPSAVVPEVHALRSALLALGVTVVPPPDLMRYLSLTPPPPPTGMIEPTNRCNLACPTCPTGTGKIAPLPDLTLERYRGVIDALRPALRNLALWNYGEPTLNKELPAFVAYAKERGVGVVKISSNVHFLSGDRGIRLLESGLDVLILSVDGASQETYATFRQHGRFARVAEAVRHLCTEKARRGLAKPSIELQFIAMRHNAHEVPEIRRLAAEWGVDRLRIKTFGAEDEVNRELVPEQPELSRYTADHATPNVVHPFCTRPWDHTVVNVDGAVTPCCYLRPDMGEEYVMGNVFETPFREIWRGAKYRDFRARMLQDRSRMPVCDRCRGSTSDLLAAVEDVVR